MEEYHNINKSKDICHIKDNDYCPQIESGYHNIVNNNQVAINVINEVEIKKNALEDSYKSDNSVIKSNIDNCKISNDEPSLYNNNITDTTIINTILKDTISISIPCKDDNNKSTFIDNNYSNNNSLSMKCDCEGSQDLPTRNSTNIVNYITCHTTDDVMISNGTNTITNTITTNTIVQHVSNEQININNDNNNNCSTMNTTSINEHNVSMNTYDRNDNKKIMIIELMNNCYNKQMDNIDSLKDDHDLFTLKTCDDNIINPCVTQNTSNCTFSSLMSTNEPIHNNTEVNHIESCREITHSIIDDMNNKNDIMENQVLHHSNNNGCIDETQSQFHITNDVINCDIESANNVSISSMTYNQSNFTNIDIDDNYKYKQPISMVSNYNKRKKPILKEKLKTRSSKRLNPIIQCDLVDVVDKKLKTSTYDNLCQDIVTTRSNTNTTNIDNCFVSIDSNNTTPIVTSIYYTDCQPIQDIVKPVSNNNNADDSVTNIDNYPPNTLSNTIDPICQSVTNINTDSNIIGLDNSSINTIIPFSIISYQPILPIVNPISPCNTISNNNTNTNSSINGSISCSSVNVTQIDDVGNMSSYLDNTNDNNTDILAFDYSSLDNLSNQSNSIQQNIDDVANVMDVCYSPITDWSAKSIATQVSTNPKHKSSQSKPQNLKSANINNAHTCTNKLVINNHPAALRESKKKKQKLSKNYIDKYSSVFDDGDDDVELLYVDT